RTSPQLRRPTRRHHPRPRPQPAASAPGPHHRRRGPRRGNPRHAAGDEHRSRRVPSHRARQLRGRRRAPPPDPGVHERSQDPLRGVARPDQRGHRRDRAPVPLPGRLTAGRRSVGGGLPKARGIPVGTAPEIPRGPLRSPAPRHRRIPPLPAAPAHRRTALHRWGKHPGHLRDPPPRRPRLPLLRRRTVNHYPLLILLITIITLVLAVWGVVVFLDGVAQRRMLAARSVLAEVERRAHGPMARLDVRLRRTELGRQIRTRLDRAGVQMKVSSFALLVAACAVAAIVIVWHVLAPLLGLCAAALVGYLFLAYLNRQEEKRREAF